MGKIVYSKKTLTLRDFLTNFYGFMRSMIKIMPTYRNKSKFKGSFREKIILTVSYANEGRYFITAHRLYGRLAGLTDKEMDKLINLKPQDFDRKEWIALKYAKEVVSKEKKEIDSKIYKELKDRYSGDEVNTINEIINMINFTTRAGNTFDMLLYRLLNKCRPKKGSSLLSEMAISLAFIIIGFPIAIYVGMLYIYFSIK